MYIHENEFMFFTFPALHHYTYYNTSKTIMYSSNEIDNIIYAFGHLIERNSTLRQRFCFQPNRL